MERKKKYIANIQMPGGKSYYYGKSSYSRGYRSNRVRGVVRLQRAWRSRQRRKKTGYNKLIKSHTTLARRVYNNLQPGWIDTNQAPISIDAVGLFKDFASLTGINCSATDHLNRIGNKITVKKIQMKAQIKVAKDDEYNEFRMLLVQIPCPIIGTTPSIQDILETSDVYSFYKKDSKISYKILYDKVFQMSNAHLTVGAPGATVDMNGCPYKNFIHFNKTWNFPKGIPVHYSGSGVLPQTGHVTKNMLWLVMVSDSTTTVITGSPTIGYNVRLSFDP